VIRSGKEIDDTMQNSEINLIDDNVKCSCRGNNLDKLVQPNILIILAKQDMHGYMIIQELEKMNTFDDEKVDNTGVYRALKTLEDRDMVKFEWVMDESGPAKKNYSITDKGLECLENWISTLETYQKKIDKIIEDAKDIFKKN
jgi:PadR family transcriptional regulator PadR